MATKTTARNEQKRSSAIKQVKPAKRTAKLEGRPATAKLFRNGRSQAVRLPKEFQFEGKEVLVSRTETGAVLLEPVLSTPERWQAFFDKLDSYDAGDPMPGGRNQGVTKPEDIFPKGW